MASSLFFNGRQYSTPTVVSTVDDSAMVPVSPSGASGIAYVGLSDGGAPNVAIKLASPSDAAAKLISGDLLTAINKAYAPSAGTGSPGAITAVRVGTPTQASLTLMDGGQTPAASVVVQTAAFGLPANQTKLKVETGTLQGLKITVQRGNVYTVQDNLLRAALTVQYLGADAVATVDVNATTLTLASGAAGSLVSTPIAFSDFPQVQQVVDRINSQPGWSATAASASALSSALNGLDFVTAQDAKTAPFTVGANTQAVIDYLNSAASSFTTGAVRATGGKSPPAVVGFTYFTGATNPATSIEDWTNAINVLETLDVAVVVPLSADPAVWAAVDAHVQYMSTAGGKERRAVVGAGTGNSVAAAPALALALNSDRTSFVDQGHYDFDASGNSVLQPAYMTAAIVGAMHAAVDPGTSLTNMPVSIDALEYNPMVPTDTDTLIQAGVLCLMSSSRGITVARDISTWLADDRYDKVENSCGAATDFVVESVRNALQPLVGKGNGPTQLARALSITETTLANLAKSPPVGPGVIVGDANSPAYANLTAEASGDTIAVSFQCSPVIPTNFVTVSVSAVPYSGTATLASS